MHDVGSRKRVLLGLALGVPVSLLLGWLAFRGADLATVGDALREVRPGPFALGVGLLLCVYVVQAVRWRMIARTPTLGLGHFLAMVVGGVGMNNVLPGRLGDLLRMRWLAVDAPMPSGRSVATVVLDRAGDVAALAFLLAVSVWTVRDAVWIEAIAVVTAVAVALIGLGLVGARLYTTRRAHGRRGRGRLRRFGRDILDGLAEPLGRRRVALVLLASLAAWSIFAVAVILIASSVGLDLTPLDALFVASVVNLGVGIPSSPGFVGTYQWLAVEALALIGVTSREASLAFAILLHTAWFVPTTLFGVGYVLVRLVRAPARA